jgi:hypothetical protein
VRSSQTDAAPSAVPWLVASGFWPRSTPQSVEAVLLLSQGLQRMLEVAIPARNGKAELYTSFAACIMASPADSCTTWNFH